MKYKPRHPLSWFRTGKIIIKNNVSDLFNPIIQIQSPAHGKSLHADQDKGNRYKAIQDK